MKRHGKFMWVDDDFDSIVTKMADEMTKKMKLSRKISKTDVTKHIAEEIKRKGWFI